MLLKVIFIFLTGATCHTSAVQYNTNLKDPLFLDLIDVLYDHHFGRKSLFSQLSSLPGFEPHNTSNYAFEKVQTEIKNGMDIEKVLVNTSTIDAFAMVSPLLNVRSACRSSSFQFLHSLLIPDGEKFFPAISMLDASSKLPNGILRDSIEFCDYVQNILGLRKCRVEKGKFHIPYGNTKGIGNSAQCHNFDDVIPARYCRIGLKKKNEEKKTIKANIGGILSAMNIEWSICIPRACSPDDVKKNYDFIFRILREVQVEILNCEEPIKESSFGVPLSLFWGLVMVLLLIGTCLDLLQINDVNFFAPLKTLSFYRSLKRTVGSEIRPGTSEEITSIGAIITLSLIWIIISNTIKSFMSGNVINQLEPLNIELKKSSAPFLYNIILNDSLPFDSICLAFGIATSFLFFRKLSKSTFSLGQYLIEHYLKFTLPILMVFSIMIIYVPYATEGPLYVPVNDNGLVDQLLHLSNFRFLFEDVKNDEMSYTWFISCLMQLCILTPLLGYSIWKRPKLGFMISIALLLLSYFFYEALIFFFNLPPLFLSSSYEKQTKSYLITPENFYRLPISLIQPFLVGILVGHISFRHVESPIKLSRVFNIGMWLLSFLMIGFCMSSSILFTNDTVYGKHIWTITESVLYTLVNKLIWSAAISWIVMSCHFGYGGVFNKILAWGPFLVFSRTMTSLYLIHNVIIDIVLRTTLSSYEFNGIVMGQYCNAIVCISLFFSVLVHAICVEPFLQILILQQPKKNKEAA
ncbi:nose resistant to fluoxetine protein 6 [Lepeophtheirus salmonis]|uniref:nose resistant to fluoxetine protein 6 n=1 Tax=Lepeophtheirus salmonis TaxID=72036 RepID=UPI001AEAAD7A|nr:nose resistant to fluoxetine protein 6-like [Lepeophtheirus salmonis]